MTTSPSESETRVWFEPEGHVYRINGWQVPSVTQIVRAYFGAPPVSADRLEALAEVGTQAHEGIAKACAFKKTHIRPRWPTWQELQLSGAAATAVERFNEVAEWMGWRPVLWEQVVVNVEAGYAGRLDLVAADGKAQFVLVDVKSGSTLSDAHVAQLGGYLLASPVFRGVPDLRRTLERDADSAGILLLRLREDSKAKWKEVDIKEATRLFRMCLDNWRLLETENAAEREEERYV